MGNSKKCKSGKKTQKQEVFECLKCGNKASKEKHLCKPSKIKKEK